MAPSSASQLLLSPAELSFIHSSLALTPPIRPDLRTPKQFRPLIAETDILASANGSARICFSDGTEAIAGVKAEVEKTVSAMPAERLASEDIDVKMRGGDDSSNSDADELEAKPMRRPAKKTTPEEVSDAWLEVSVEIPGFRDDDNLPVFLGAMLTETLLASDVTLKEKLWINARWHWKLYVDILLLSQPLSYPLPLLSLTTHLALLNSSLPRLTSEPSDDPLFDDDWDAAIPLYPRSSKPGSSSQPASRPPITLLVMTVGDNVIFDPSKEELAVAESVLAVSAIPTTSRSELGGSAMKLLAIRTVDPPSRITPLGIPNSINPATGGDPSASSLESPAKTGTQASAAQQEALVEQDKEKLWSPPRGGVKRSLIAKIIKAVIERDGVGEEVLAGLAGIEA